MEIILALDFDGTLYRLEEHDSEEMLMAAAAVTDEEKSQMDISIAEMRAGADPIEFELVLRDMLIGKPLSVIEKAIESIMPLVDWREIDVIRRIVSRADVHLHIVSCGTDMLVSEFLQRVGLFEYTEGIHAKELLHDESTFRNFIWHIRGPEDKRRCVENLRTGYENPFIVAVGDGFTDGPMLSAADRGFLIERPGCMHHEVDADVISSFDELLHFMNNI